MWRVFGRRKVSRALALAAMAALTASSASAQTPRKGGILNFAVVASPPSYDCHSEITFGAVHPIAPHYSLLLKIDGAKGFLGTVEVKREFTDADQRG